MKRLEAVPFLFSLVDYDFLKSWKYLGISRENQSQTLVCIKSNLKKMQQFVPFNDGNDRQLWLRWKDVIMCTMTRCGMIAFILSDFQNVKTKNCSHGLHIDIQNT